MPDKRDTWYMEFPHGKWMKLYGTSTDQVNTHFMGMGLITTYHVRTCINHSPPKNGWDTVQTLSNC